MRIYNTTHLSAWHISAMLFLAIAVSACGTQSIRPYAENLVETEPSEVIVLYSFPDRIFTKIGAVTIRHYQPGFADPTVEDALEKLQNAGAQLGANALVVIDTQTGGDRTILIRAEGILYEE